jgi:hypothetical protein
MDFLPLKKKWHLEIPLPLLRTEKRRRNTTKYLGKGKNNK